MSSGTFYAAPFAVDGEPIGIGSWSVSDLSPDRLKVCERMLAEGGSVFRSPFASPLSHLEVRFTSANGAAMATFFANGKVAVSAAYLRGEDPAIEQEVLEMFVTSLKNVDLVKRAKASQSPFQGVFLVRERPLHVVVPWGNPDVSEEDDDVIGEVSNHFAAAYLCQVEF
jgi:hypothetical protein